MEPHFLLSLDSDSRHSMRHMWPDIDHPEHAPHPAQDRRDIPAGQPGHIALHPTYNYVPSAPRVPDCIQFPIESLFAAVKREFRRLINAIPNDTARDMFDAMHAAFERAATQASIERRFDHAERCMVVFSGEIGSIVELDGVVYHCVQGGWLPKVLRA
eukprot:jgi/Ulvmu1/3385/UM016_0001.1